jgi:hypothetical protein
MAFQRQESVGQKADPTHHENQSDEKEGQRSNRLSDRVEASCEHDTMTPMPKGYYRNNGRSKPL